MMRGLPASIAFHAVVFAVGYYGWPFMTASTRDYDSEIVEVPIELVDIGALNNISEVLRPQPEPEDEIEPVEEEEAEDQPEEEPEPIDEEIPEGEFDTASEQAPPEETEPEETVPDFDADPEPAEAPEEPEPEPEKPVVRQADPLDDFLNAADSTFQSERQTRREREEPKPLPKRLLDDTPPKPQEIRKGAGDRTANTARLEALLYAQVRSEWSGVADLANSSELNVEMRVLLDRKGNIIDGPHLVSPSRAPIGNRPMRTAIDRAMSAVRKAAPYSLPEQDYEDWDDYHIIRLGPSYE